jgi:hypothetical protein
MKKERPALEEALAERDRALAEQPVDTTAELMGDPPPSRSALHRPKPAAKRRRVTLDREQIAQILAARAKAASNGEGVR